MTPLEARAITALSKCSARYYGIDSAVIMSWTKMDKAQEITPHGKKFLWKLVYRYKKQIKDAELIEYAETQKE